MRALRFKETGDLGNLAVEDVPQPEPQAHELLVQVKAAGMNKSDTTNVLGLFPYTTVPRTPGRDFAGTVVYLASDEASFITGVALEVDGGRCI